ncbi:MAG: glycosyltransferase [Rhizobiaceae bacterium]|nr:glycosyltransferase [Rhizobiaceae bacterium]
MKIVHCFRSPVGGIFRHVRDLLKEQVKSGYEVGFICDSSTGGDYEDNLFEGIKDNLALGLHRIPMARSISPKDPFTLLKVARIIRQIGPDIVHSHSAKGGVYGRMAAKLATSRGKSAKAFYCPHGGAMHYDKASIKGRVFFAAERFLERYTDSLIFVSGYEQAAYEDKVGKPTCSQAIVYNGLSEPEFEPVPLAKDSADFLYIGMMRDLKGPDVFIEAFNIARLQTGEDLTAVFVGDGADKPKYIDRIVELGLQSKISVHDAMPAREAFALADTVVVPSRAESLPYLVLEAIAARKPIVSTDVGGIHEIFDDARDQLVEPDNPTALAEAMIAMRKNKNRKKEATEFSERLKDRFSVDAMAKGIEAVYIR